MTKHNKQHAPRAASFKRIAKALRAIGKGAPDLDYWSRKALREIAKVLDAEAKLLRSLR